MEASRSQQRRVQRVRSVRRHEHLRVQTQLGTCARLNFDDAPEWVWDSTVCGLSSVRSRESSNSSSRTAYRSSHSLDTQSRDVCRDSREVSKTRRGTLLGALMFPRGSKPAPSRDRWVFENGGDDISRRERKKVGPTRSCGPCDLRALSNVPIGHARRLE